MMDNIDPDACLRVSLCDYEHNPLLTEIYHSRGSIFSRAARSPDTCYYLSSLSIDDCLGQRVVVLRRILDKQKITLLFILLLLTSPALGVVVGSVSHRADVGIAVAVRIFALASMLQALAAWFER